MQQIINEKECRLCTITKPLDSFNKSICGKYDYANECKECRQKARKELNYERIKEGTKLCNNCGIEKDIGDFNSDSKNIDGLRSTCKLCSIKCVNKYCSTFDGFIKNLYKDLVSNAKNRNIQVNITIDDIINQYNFQVGLCALTKLKMTWNKLPIESSTHINNQFNISVDRIDSTQAYTKDNIQLVCAQVNIIKYSIPTKKFIEICKKISQQKLLFTKNI